LKEKNMTVSITMYGTDAQYWNAGPSSGTVSAKDLLINTNSTINTVNFKLSAGGSIFTGTLNGNFQFNGPISTGDKISGTLLDATIYQDGLIKERDVITQGTDLQNFLFSSTTVPQYIFQASMLNSGITFVGSTTAQAYGDTLIGGKANDSFTSYAGKLPVGQWAYFDGKGGIDVSIMQGKIADYKIETKNINDQTDLTYKARVNGWQVTDNVANRNGVTQLANVERLKFLVADPLTGANAVALDNGPTDNAGSVYMLYKAAFNRAPDNGGMGYWLAQKDSGKDIVTSLAQGFVASKEFTDKYGTNPSNASYVDKLYQNVLNRAGDSGGVTYWNQELDAGRISKAAVLVQFATLAEGAANVASLIANGIPYTEFVS
jgi:hypothetical protein